MSVTANTKEVKHATLWLQGRRPIAMNVGMLVYDRSTHIIYRILTLTETTGTWWSGKGWSSCVARVTSVLNTAVTKRERVITVNLGCFRPVTKEYIAKRIKKAEQALANLQELEATMETP